MSTLRIQRIEAKAFKAFKHLDFKLDSRHLLAYGANGSGKSSLYWTLYTFLQSAQKEQTDITKYFDENLAENLIHRHSTQAERDDASIALTLQNESASIGCVYNLAKGQHDTHKVPDILKGNLASDFITYRILFSFYHFRNSQTIDLWPVFEQEMLPFCQGTSVKDLASLWREIQEARPFETSRAAGETAWRRKKRYESFDHKIDRFNTALTGVLANITKEAQQFYDANFGEPGEPKLDLIVGMTRPATKYYRDKHIHLPPAIGFEIKVDGKPIPKPHAFLNEAKLTQLALSVRFGATLAHLHESPLKILVLDDLLISLDMSNRMKVVDIILGKTFATYQKIVLTHDLGFFNEVRRRIGVQHTDWSFQHFKPTLGTGICLKEAKTDIQKAEDYLNGQNLDEAANCLRKAADATATRFSNGTVVATKDFVTLTEQLRSARKRLLEKVPIRLYEKVLRGVSEKHRQYLVPGTDIGLSTVPGITPEELTELVRLRKQLSSVITNEHWQMVENAKTIDEVVATTERVLNPGSHGGEVPLYEAEVRQALDLIKKLEKCLS